MSGWRQCGNYTRPIATNDGAAQGLLPDMQQEPDRIELRILSEMWKYAVVG